MACVQVDGQKNALVQKAEDLLEGAKGTGGGKFDGMINQAGTLIDEVRCLTS
jgi:hypothetical protein